MATASKGGFNADRFRKLVAHFRNSNANERDNAFHLAIAELGKASADVFRDMPDVVAELIGGAGSNETDELRRELERQLAQSRAREAESRAEANENIAEAARRKAESEQAQEIIDRLRKRIAELEAGATRKPPVEDRKPEPPPAPPPSSPPWYENITPEPEPEPGDETGEGETAWIEIPKWNAVFWIVLVLGAGSYAVLAAMIERPLTSDDWGRLFYYWWSWLFIPVVLAVVGRGLYKFAGFIEDAVIIQHFPGLCLRIRWLLVSPVAMLIALAGVAGLWAVFVVLWAIGTNNPLPPAPVITGGVAFLVIYGLTTGKDEYEKFGAAGMVCKLCLFVVWLAAVGSLVAVAVIFVFKLSVVWSLVISGVLAAGIFTYLEDRLTSWALADKRRFAGAVVLAALVLLAFGIVLGNQSEAKHAPSPAPQTAAPKVTLTPKQKRAFDEWNLSRKRQKATTSEKAAQQ